MEYLNENNVNDSSEHKLYQLLLKDSQCPLELILDQEDLLSELKSANKPLID